MPDNRHVPLAIVGGGPAGLTAAIYAARMGIDFELFERAVAGGQIFMTDKIENYPGFPEGISGPELADRMREQALRLGAKITQAELTGVELTENSKKLALSNGSTVTCDAVIVATGSKPNQLGVSGEKELWGRGVSYCAVCDGNFYRGQPVAVVGGGNSAVQEANMLANICKEVYIVHRRDQFRAQEYLSKCALETGNIKILWNTVVERIEGVQGVDAVHLKDVKTDERSRLPVSGVFIYVGIKPMTDFLGGQVSLTEDGYIDAGEDTRTNVPGVFAAGDVRKKPARQIATAVADGATSIHLVDTYFIEKGLSCRYV